MAAGRRAVTADVTRDSAERALLADLRCIIQTVNRHAAHVEKSCGVSTTQLTALELISGQPGVRVTGVSEALGVHASTASNMLDKLEAKGLIERRRGGTDQRTVSLYATPAGKRLLLESPGSHRHLLQEALHSLQDRDLKSIAASLGKLRALLANA